MKIYLLMLLAFCSAAFAEDRTYVFGTKTTYRVAGAFEDTITFKTTKTGWGLIEIVSTDAKVSCGYRCTVAVPTVQFAAVNDDGEIIADVHGPAGIYSPLRVMDFIKRYCYQHTGHQLMQFEGWRFYLIPGTYTIRVPGISRQAQGSYWVSVRSAADDGCGS